MEVHENAAEIEEMLKSDPELGVEQIAEKLNLSVDEIIGVIDSHYVDEGGNIENSGPGLGGGWHPARLADAEAEEEAKAKAEPLE